MPNQNLNLQVIRNFCGVVMIALGTATIFGWSCNHPELVQLVPHVRGMAPGAALCFFLFGIGVITHNRSVGICCGDAIHFICATAIIEFVLKADFKLFHYLITPEMTDLSATSSQMAFNAIVAFILGATSLIRIHRNDEKSSPVFVCVCIILCGSLGVTSMLGHFLSLETTYGWSEYIKMAPATAAALIFLSFSLIEMFSNRFSLQIKGKLWWASMGSISIGVTVSMLLWAWSIRSQANFIHTEVSYKGEAFLALVKNKLRSDIELLQSTEGFFAGSNWVSRDEFKTFVTPMLNNHRSIVGVDWAPRVEASKRAQIERTISAYDPPHPRFILQLDDQKKLASREQDIVYYPVIYTEPYERNKMALGFDHYSDLIRRIVMDQAAEDGSPHSTGLIHLFRLGEATYEPSDFLVMMPSYIDGGKRELRGFIIGVFRSFELVQDCLGSGATLPLDFKIQADDGSPTPFLIYENGSLANAALESSRSGFPTDTLSFSDSIDVAGQGWKVTFSPSKEYLISLQSWTPTLVLIGGLLLTTLTSFYIFFLRARNKKVTELVDRATQEISSMNEKLEKRVKERTLEYEHTNDLLAKEVNERKAVEEALRIDGENQKELINVQRDIAYVGNSIDAAMDIIMERTQNVTGAEGSVVEILDGNEILYYAVHGIAKSHIGFRFKKEGSFSGLCIAKNETLSCEDSELDSRVNREACRKINARSMVVVPLNEDGRGVGALKVYSSRPHAFNAKSVTNLQLLAGVMSSALRNASVLGALQQSEEQFKNAFTHASIGIALVRLDGSWLKVNRSLCAIVGYTEEELMGKSFQEITHPEDLTKDLEYVQAMLDQSIDTYQMEKRYIHKDGIPIWVLLSVSLVTDQYGKPLHFISQIQDIHLRKSAENSIAEKNLLLERATEFKSQFLANMSHEIRTPLTSIMGYAESLISDEVTKEEETLALTTILRNSRHLLGVINDILDLSKIEAGKLDVESIPVSLFDSISDVGNLMQHKAMEQGISFGFDYQYPLPKTIQTDPLRLKQILINLIGNAIKFTKQGGVKLVLSSDSDEETISFAIIDTGVGLSPEQQERLFKAFSQGDTSTTRKFGGTGLGLVISQQLASKLGGGIIVESSPGRGSTFTLKISTGPIDFDSLIRLKPTSQRALLPQSKESVRLSGRVLVAEDGPDNQQYISYLLEKAEIDFVLVANGELAIEQLHKESFDLVLMDMQMPCMDGYTATRNLRDQGFTIPIVALTANGMAQDIARCMAAGCTDFLGKPFERSAFFLKLQNYLMAREAKQEGDSIRPLIDDEDYLPIVNTFIDKLPSRLAEMKEAIDESKWDVLSMLAHRLRGASMFGFPQLGDVAGVLEDLIKEGTSFDFNKSYEELKDICRKIENGRSLS